MGHKKLRQKKNRQVSHAALPKSKPRQSCVIEPLDAAAFHGLAGEIVRLIEPHTEADPAALLFQLLAAFGNIIGRNAYMIADGTRHHFNVFGVLVGQTSKSRKGTSWVHIGNLFERVDPDWMSDHVTSGLSSGEGLIWHVRDSVTVAKPIKHNGRFTGGYDMVCIDPGVADKRLLVVESEFAGALKAMQREGNTLSPIIRRAWDGLTLKTLVKNQPTKATGAHISVVGHVTREEVRRLLNQTEIANGLANRFNWVAVTRSKCLPEGGRIETVNFDAVVEQLKLAVEFARNAGELKRDGDSRRLWNEIYPQLSEGRPGMLGAVIGRAEAQVLRLSGIYSLLDQSKIIRPEHHYAAIALWGYCERSAGWIFGTVTGDPNADKILTALRCADSVGMTKTEISKQVFNKNLSSDTLSDALRIIHESKQAKSRNEVTGGAPSERWFAAGASTNLTNEVRIDGPNSFNSSPVGDKFLRDSIGGVGGCVHKKRNGGSQTCQIKKKN